MARIRTIKPDAFASETLSKLSMEAERSFFGLLTQVDDKGRAKDRPAVLNGALWPLRPGHGKEDMARDMDAMVEADGLLCRYEVDGSQYFHLPTFLVHQVINRPSESKMPACPRCDALTLASQPKSNVSQLPFGDTAAS